MVIVVFEHTISDFFVTSYLPVVSYHGVELISLYNRTRQTPGIGHGPLPEIKGSRASVTAASTKRFGIMS